MHCTSRMQLTWPRASSYRAPVSISFPFASPLWRFELPQKQTSMCRRIPHTQPNPLQQQGENKPTVFNDLNQRTAELSAHNQTLFSQKGISVTPRYNRPTGHRNHTFEEEYMSVRGVFHVGRWIDWWKISSNRSMWTYPRLPLTNHGMRAASVEIEPDHRRSAIDA